MNCFDAQDALWMGEKSAELQAHLNSCSVCRSEANTIRLIVEQAGSLKIPQPSRSLLPSRDIIRASVMRNQSASWTKKASVAAGILVLLGAGGIAYQLDHQNSTQQHQGTTPLINTPSTMDPPAPVTQKSAVTISISPNAQNQEICKAIQSYLSKVASPKIVREIELTDFQVDPGSTDKKTTGVLHLNAHLQQDGNPSTISTPFTFTEGSQTRYVLLDKPDGAWAVDGLGTAPGQFFNADGGTSGPTAGDLNQTLQKLEGTVAEVHFEPLDDAGNNRMLIDLVLNVEKNLTPGGTFKPTESVRVEISQTVPKSGQGSFDLTPGERLIVTIKQSDPRMNAGEVTWGCNDLNLIYFQKGDHYVNRFGYAVNP